MLKNITPELFAALNCPVPRYTSYPTAPEWHDIAADTYVNQLTKAQEPFSLYIHIPFCHSMCLFCGCSVILNRSPDRESIYVNYLKKEMDLIANVIGHGKKVTQLHFGGGTPTKLSIDLLLDLFHHLNTLFSIQFDREVAIEIDPRTVFNDQGSKLKLLKKLGFNRVSFGVQDLNREVQEAIKRRQTEEMTISTYQYARDLGFAGINIDLIYGLPKQTLETFTATIDKICELKPDRIALFSYAKIPWLKPHQNAIADDLLPTTQEKFAIYAMARKELIAAGYIAIGMDHFALPSDELAKAYKDKKLQRNFQGYSLKQADHHLGIGVTAIGLAANGYFQNLKDISSYYQMIDQGLLPVHRGKILDQDDDIRKQVIHGLMCDFLLDKKRFLLDTGIKFEDYFNQELPFLAELALSKLIRDTADVLYVTELGELFIRNVVVIFDRYFVQKPHFRKFSQAI